MGFFRQLRYLLWKNWLLRKRQKVWVAVEICWPLVLFGILAWVRTRPLVEGVDKCFFAAKALPSAGFLPFLQSLVCGLPNTCLNSSNGDWDIGPAQGYANSSFLKSTLAFVDSIAQPLVAQELSQDVIGTVEDINKIPYCTNCSFDESITPMKDLLKDVKTAESDLVSCGASENASRILLASELSPLFPFVLASKAPSLLSHLFPSSTNASQIPDPSTLMARIRANIGNISESVFNELLCSKALLNLSLANATEDEIDAIVEGMCNRTKVACLLFKWALPPSMINGSVFFDLLGRSMSYVTGLELGVSEATIVAVRVQQAMAWDTRLGLSSMGASFNISNSFQTLACNQTADDYIGQVLRTGTLLEGLQDQGRKFRREGMMGMNETRSVTVELQLDTEIDNNGTLNETLCGLRLENLRGLESCMVVQTALKNAPKIIQKILSSLLRGFILIGPGSSPAVQRVAEKVEHWFDAFEPAKDAIFRLLYHPGNVTRDILSSSIGPAIDKILFVAKRSRETLSPLNNTSGTFHASLQRGWALAERFQSTLEALKSDNISTEELLLNEDYGMRFVYHLASCVGGRSRFAFVENQTEMEEKGLCLQSLAKPLNDLYYSGLWFHVEKEANKFPPAMQYSIRMNPNLVDGTLSVTDREWSETARARPMWDMKYTTYGFVYLQDQVDRAIIADQTGLSQLPTAAYSQMFPNVCYTNDMFVRMVQRMMPLLMTISWVFSASLIVKNVVYEKERRLKEVMKVMGLGDLVHWVAWFITSIILITLSTFILVLLLHFGRIISLADPSILFVFIFLYGTATVSQAFLISTLFGKANLAAACGAVLYFILYLPYGLMIPNAQFIAHRVKVGSCAISQVAFGWGCSLLGYWEYEQSGAQWSNLWQSPIFLEKLTLGTVFTSLILDTFGHLILTWYIEAVIPGEYGMPRPFYFPFTRSYWCGPSSNSVESEEMNGIVGSSMGADEEALSEGAEKGVEIIHLRKVYGNGKLAVDNLSIVFLKNQITSFLGHNGAGKTTTLSILTGLFPPTSGKVIVGGWDIQKDFVEIRKSLGMCPQHNVLYDYLTVEEQLEFYAGLKGVTSKKMVEEMDTMIQDIGMPDKRQTLAKDLSGGMQRKLSIAMAFVGGSKTVVLDEPTAGCDPHARRSIWDLLLKQKVGRTIVLSTHHMDEADILGDRIAIISAGNLKTSGSSMFLKKKFGQGFSLSISRVLQPMVDRVGVLDGPVSVSRKLPPLNGATNGANQASALPAIGHSNGVTLTGVAANPPDPGVAHPSREVALRQISDLVTASFPQARLQEEVGEELRFSLGADAKASDLAVFFKRLDADKSHLPIESYGVSDTTLEQIFLTIAGYEDEQRFLQKGCCSCANVKARLARFRLRKAQGPDDAIGLAGAEEVLAGRSAENAGRSTHSELTRHRHSRFWLAKRRLRALLVKRWHNFRRSPKGALAEIVLPVAMVMLSLIWAELIPEKPLNSPPMLLSPSLLQSDEGENNILFSRESPLSPKSSVPINEAGKRALDTWLEPPGIGTRCMSTDPVTERKYRYSCQSAANKWSSLPVSGGNSSLPECCECVTVGKGRYWECGEEYMPPLPYMATNSTATLIDLSLRNITEWLLQTEKTYRHKRYGGASLGNIVPFVLSKEVGIVTELPKRLSLVKSIWEDTLDKLNVSLRDIPPVEGAANVSVASQLEALFSGLNVRSSIKVWYNNRGWPSLPAYLNVVNNGLLRAHLGTGQDPRDYGIFTWQHPMNSTSAQMDIEGDAGAEGIRQLLEVVLLLLAFSIVPASFVLFLIEERITHAKHLQSVAGLSPLLYWLANFLWDIVNYSVPVLLCYIVYACFGEASLILNWYQGMASFLLFMSYGVATIGLMYPWVFVFRIPSLAFICLGIGNFFIGVTATVVIQVLDQLKSGDEDLQQVFDVCSVIFKLFPQYCFGRGIILMKIDYYVWKFKGQFGYDGGVPNSSATIYPLVGIMLAQGVFWFVVVLLIEYLPLWIRVKGSNKGKDRSSESDGEEVGEDDDVAAERRRVAQADPSLTPLLIKNLGKVYTSRKTCGGTKKLKAVNNLCVGVKKGECLGLLGVNGAGKTTTFKMLTGKTAVSSGDAEFFGASVRTEIGRVQQLLGYCPQFDALNPRLTGREMLSFYARLRGVEEESIQAVVEWAVSHMQLQAYASHQCGKYSGGNKRKLSTAIALLGKPAIVLLDEPTTGMDPAARRFTWERIAEIVRQGRSVILTSHSMEECEALCGRIGIMVGGKLKCLGSLQRLKTKYGEGYSLSLKMRSANFLPSAKSWVSSAFPSAKLEDSHGPMLYYQLPSGSSSPPLSQIFAAISEAQASIGLEDYSLSQTSLDDVFLRFAAEHYDAMKDEPVKESEPKEEDREEPPEDPQPQPTVLV